MIRTRFPLAVALTLFTVAAIGCRKEEVPPADSAAAAPAPPPAAMVTTIETGKHIDANKRIVDTATAFAPRDTMYVSVLTAARGAGTITVKWSLYGRVLHEVTKKLSYNGQAATDFRFQAADGFPVGDYTVEVILDGKTIETRRVKVE